MTQTFNNWLFLGTGWLITSFLISPLFRPITNDWLLYFVGLPLILIVIGLVKHRIDVQRTA
jgi:hypothetical protein